MTLPFGAPASPELMWQALLAESLPEGRAGSLSDETGPVPGPRRD